MEGQVEGRLRPYPVPHTVREGPGLKHHPYEGVAVPAFFGVLRGIPVAVVPVGRIGREGHYPDLVFLLIVLELEDRELIAPAIVIARHGRVRRRTPVGIDVGQLRIQSEGRIGIGGRLDIVVIGHQVEELKGHMAVVGPVGIARKRDLSPQDPLGEVYPEPVIMGDGPVTGDMDGPRCGLPLMPYRFARSQIGQSDAEYGRRSR